MKHLIAACILVLASQVASADVASDKKLFDAKCAKCHNESGTGTFMLNRRLGKDKSLLEQRTDLAPGFVRHVVRNGILGMPPFTRVEVTDAELDAIVRYLNRSRP